ncbi:MAG: hypothetical protein U0136_14030 [Bdellovibrionota bacterium]
MRRNIAEIIYHFILGRFEQSGYTNGGGRARPSAHEEVKARSRHKYLAVTRSYTERDVPA